mmetsp:Transcript_20533/g.41393  ORF Transcript_20533/g.41393 Transcript_20533/m.41393 type:complete len:250 (+) Transcript_20533:224-973(+)
MTGSQQSNTSISVVWSRVCDRATALPKNACIQPIFGALSHCSGSKLDRCVLLDSQQNQIDMTVLDPNPYFHRPSLACAFFRDATIFLRVTGLHKQHSAPANCMLPVSASSSPDTPTIIPPKFNFLSSHMHSVPDIPSIHWSISTTSNSSTAHTCSASSPLATVLALCPRFRHSFASILRLILLSSTTRMRSPFSSWCSSPSSIAFAPSSIAASLGPAEYGSVNEKVAPLPSSDTRVISPQCASTIAREM